jgi:hypothetical protein
MRIYLMCLFARRFTYVAIFLAPLTSGMAIVMLSMVGQSDLPIPTEVLEFFFVLDALCAPIAIVAIPLCAAWEARRIYQKIYFYILRDGPERYWAVTRYHGGCAYVAFRIAEYETRNLRRQNYVPQ